MEILKFDGADSSSSSRKRSGRGAILVTFIALVFGAGTALASGTLTINTDNTIALDQGVANSVQCDTAITVSLGTAYDVGSTDFVFTGVDISDIDVSTMPNNCFNKYFTIKTYDQTGSLQIFCVNGIDSGCAADGKSAKLQVATSTLSYSFTRGLATGTPGSINVKNVTVESSNS
ncbi:MAG: hypothetical protein F2896_01405 [Actinobacteria bacterium]|jgi:hypothetical protein|uniref:Unannotated protein n=1 Tax=freshwater metagenome TaxID=449393 RepID=A0A6J5YPB5_9ZZZZ|nr:hypothetical protein [Actinomycetota bacterium]